MSCIDCIDSHRAKRAAKVVSDHIDKYIEKDAKNALMSKSFLLYGSCCSGRSTFLKQMEYSYGYGFTEQELTNYKFTVYNHTVGGMTHILREMKRRKIAFADERSCKHEEKLTAIAKRLSFSDTVFSEELVNALKALWEDESVQDTFKRFDFQSSSGYYWTVAYFMSDIDRIRQLSYIPSFKDVICLRLPSSGIKESIVEYVGITFRFVDPRIYFPGPDRWLHHFLQYNTIIMYFIDISEYDEWLNGEEGSSKLQDTLLRYEAFCRNPRFSRMPMILMLNKKDLFEEKLATRPLTLCFPEYEGGREYEEASEYVKTQFESKHRNRIGNVDVYFLCAIDTWNVRFVFDGISSMILKKLLDDPFSPNPDTRSYFERWLAQRNSV